MKKVTTTAMLSLLLAWSYSYGDSGCERTLNLTREEKDFQKIQAGQIRKAFPAAPSGWGLESLDHFTDTYSDRGCTGKKMPSNFTVSLTYSKALTSTSSFETCNKQMQAAIARNDSAWLQNEFPKCMSGAGIGRVSFTVVANEGTSVGLSIGDFRLDQVSPVEVKGPRYALRRKLAGEENNFYLLFGHWEKAGHDPNLLISQPKKQTANAIETLGIKVEGDEKSAMELVRKINFTALQGLMK